MGDCCSSHCNSMEQHPGSPENDHLPSLLSLPPNVILYTLSQLGDVAAIVRASCCTKALHELVRSSQWDSVHHIRIPSSPSFLKSSPWIKHRFPALFSIYGDCSCREAALSALAPQSRLCRLAMPGQWRSRGEQAIPPFTATLQALDVSHTAFPLCEPPAGWLAGVTALTELCAAGLVVQPRRCRHHGSRDCGCAVRAAI